MMTSLTDGTSLIWMAAAIIIGYALGSIPFGLIFTRMAGLGDIRDIGSGNIGATNALRTGNKSVALGTLVCDALKGTIAVFIAGHYLGSSALILPMLAALAAFLGHLYPVWLGFKGGKGVSTFIGIWLAVFWPVALLFAATWLAVAYFTRMSSLAALVAAALTPIYLAWLDRWEWVLPSILLVAFIYLAHRANISRLLAGTEPKIGASKTE
ncbi:MAG: glycerol-3-phosphate 1-O-acyltransferase PlsY [Rhizobiales bacterium]|nr:glycerol-3-phosphate 1-O-acyltransferase PlsY [Hyphomicrobiales bacterium]